MNGVDVSGSVWLCIPSARPVAEVNACIDKWREKGYRVALWRDKEEEGLRADLVMVGTGQYPGYAAAVNALAKHVLMLEDPGCDWVVTAGDDTFPDSRDPQEIARELTEHFKGTFAVCQPTGDRWADAMGPIIDRIAGSPWIGREWCLRAHGGAGPYFPGLLHMGVDDAIKFAAEQEGVYLMRQDLTHYHQHFTRKGESVDWSDGPPEHLKWCNTPSHWDEFKRIFEQFKAEYHQRWRPLPA